MANIFLPDPSLAPAHISAANLFARVSTAKDRAAVLDALADYDQQQAWHRDLAVPFLAGPARDKLTAAGIKTIDDAGFRTHYLEGRPSSEREQIHWVIALRIVERLRQTVQPVIRRIKQAAIAALESDLPKGGHPDAELSERYGLPAPQESAVFASIRRARDDMRAALDEPLDLSLNGNRRATLSVFFAKTL